MPDDDNFTHAQTHPVWADWSKFLRVGWGRRRNQLCKIFWKSVQRFRSWKTLKNGISHWNRSSPLQQCCATSQTVIVCISIKIVHDYACVCSSHWCGRHWWRRWSWIWWWASVLGWLSSVLRPRHLQHSIGYMGNGFYRSKDPTSNKGKATKENQKTQTTKYTYTYTIIHIKRIHI